MIIKGFKDWNSILNVFKIVKTNKSILKQPKDWSKFI